MKSSKKNPLKWSAKEIDVLRQNISLKEMETLLPKRNYTSITVKRSQLGIVTNSSASSRAKEAWKTRKASKGNTGNVSKEPKGKKLIPKSDFKFVMNGIPVTIGADVKNAFIGKDRIEINF